MCAHLRRGSLTHPDKRCTAAARLHRPRRGGEGGPDPGPGPAAPLAPSFKPSPWPGPKLRFPGRSPRPLSPRPRSRSSRLPPDPAHPPAQPAPGSPGPRSESSLRPHPFPGRICVLLAAVQRPILQVCATSCSNLCEPWQQSIIDGPISWQASYPLQLACNVLDLDGLFRRGRAPEPRRQRSCPSLCLRLGRRRS